MKPWEEKANRLIGSLCYQSYMQANRLANGSLARKHRPYTVPQLAQDLIDCLNTDNEEKAKAIFLSYDGMKIL